LNLIYESSLGLDGWPRTSTKSDETVQAAFYDVSINLSTMPSSVQMTVT